MKVVYIAGPYRDVRGEWFVRQNIRKAEEASVSVWQCGGVGLCPHKNTAGFGGIPGCPDETWLLGDMELLSRSDAIFMVDGWERSSGAREELNFARKHGITVLYTLEDIIEFLL